MWSDIYLLMVLYADNVLEYSNIDEKVKEQLFTEIKTTVNKSLLNKNDQKETN